jgi:hypothetical protein
MREAATFFLYLLVCLLIGALLTYPLIQTGWIGHDPHRVLGRVVQLVALASLWPFLRAMHLDNRGALGYRVPRRQFLGALWRGWLLGVAILLPLALGILLLGIRVPDIAAEDWLPRLLEKAVTVLIGGLLIGLLEETFFRGALYYGIRRSGGALRAIFWSAFLFALLHFMKPHALPEGTPFDWSGLWQMLGHVFAGVLQWKHLDSMAALFMVGIFLALVRERTGHIGWCMGVHAGSVFTIQMTRYLTEGVPASPHAWLVGDYDGIMGWLAGAWLGLLALGSLVWEREKVRLG